MNCLRDSRVRFDERILTAEFLLREAEASIHGEASQATEHESSKN